METINVRSVREAQELTQEYARFAREWNGVGNVLGGISFLVAYFAVNLLQSGILPKAIALGLLILWLIGKELIRRKVYLVFGEAYTKLTRKERWNRIWRVALVVIAASVIWLLYATSEDALTDSRAWLILVVWTIAPWITWHYVRNSYEYYLACMLLTIGTAEFSFLQFVDWWIWWLTLILAIAMIVVGMIQHHRFQELGGRLRAYQEIEDE